MSDLSNDLASLRLDEPPARSRRGLWVTLAVLLVLASAGIFAWRSTAAMRALAVETIQPTVERGGRAAAVIVAGIARDRKEIHFPRVFSTMLKIVRILPFPLYERIVRRATAGQRRARGSVAGR